MIFLLCFVISFILSLVITPIVKFLAYRLNLLDRPNHRKIHSEPMPLTGGLAIFLALAITLLCFGLLSKEMLWIVGTSFIFILFGLVDDAGISIRARYKIWVRFIIACIFIYFSGIHFQFFKYLWINYLLTAGFITFMMNSMNMLDGMDGLVSGIAFLSAGFFAMLAINSGQTDILLFALAIMGATLGFLRYNFNPASIFLGEAGSTLLGFLLSIIAVKICIYGLWNVALMLGVERLQFISFIVPLIVLGIPIFDTYFVFANRFLHHIKFSQPGKDHSHHRIHLMGFSQKATVLTLYAVQFVLGFIALSMVRADVQQFFALLSIVAVLFVVFTTFLLRVKVYAS